jgi:hypothetical protein
MDGEVVAFRAGLGGSLRLRSRESGSCFLNRSGVMVLVTSERCPSGECLLAVNVRTLIRTLARVDSTMAGERTAITERLEGQRC